MRDTELRHVPDAFAAEADRSFAALPEPFRSLAAGVVVQVLDWPQPDVLAHFSITSPYGLLGLYHGISLGLKSVMSSGNTPDLVFLYRYPIISYADANDECIADVINHVLVHEIGHHFGLSDDDMEAIETSSERS